MVTKTLSAMMTTEALARHSAARTHVLATTGLHTRIRPHLAFGSTLNQTRKPLVKMSINAYEKQPDKHGESPEKKAVITKQSRESIKKDNELIKRNCQLLNCSPNTLEKIVNDEEYRNKFIKDWLINQRKDSKKIFDFVIPSKEKDIEDTKGFLTNIMSVFGTVILVGLKKDIPELKKAFERRKERPSLWDMFKPKKELGLDLDR